MKELPVYKISVGNESGFCWIRYFINRPDNASVLSAMLVDCRKEIDSGEADDHRKNRIAHKYDCLGKLVEEHRLPEKPHSYRICTYAGVEVGHIEVREEYSAIFTESGE